MNYADYEALVMKMLSELRDGANAADASIALHALESVYDRGVAKESLAALSASNSGCCKEDDKIDPMVLIQEYLDLTEEEHKLHFSACKEAMFRRLSPGVVDVG